MTEGEGGAWVAATNRASVRLVGEVDREVDDILEHAERTSLDQLAGLVVRLKESADAAEVASDLAALLWAEGEDTPPIETILGEPSVREALGVVAEARQLAARRLADGAVVEARRRVDQALVAGPTAASRSAEVPSVAPVDAAVEPRSPVEPKPALRATPVAPILDPGATDRRSLSSVRASLLSWSRRARPAFGRACREVPWW